MKNEMKVFEYNGNEVSFDFGQDVMINATEMAKAFGKTPKDYLRTQSANDLIEAVSARHKCLTTDLVRVMQGGNIQGTWMEETIALDFAQWLSVDFKLWCSDRIKEVLKFGATAINPDDLLNPDFIIKLATALKTERAEKALAIEANRIAQERILEMKPKVLFADSVETSTDSILIGELAKVLNQNGIEIGQNRLFAYLRNNSYLMSRGLSRNQPQQRYMEQGLFEIRKVVINLPNGGIKTNTTTKVTGKGQLYFVNKFLKEGING